MGSALEQKWGAGKFNLYVFLAYLGTMGVAFLTPSVIATNYYIYLSVYMAFAAFYPDFELYLFFVVPVKIKWLAWMVAGLTALEFLGSGTAGRLAILVAAGNFLIFFGPGFLKRTRENVRTIRVEIREAQEESKPFHVCGVCSATEKTRPDLIFRVCSACAGGVEYCAEHLTAHVHRAG